ncbi:hypothetical protein BUE76_22050 [Cnuella takakiae]|nr:hypothetical protein BUE76_22050 [Cnuella takakiae]
MLIWLQYLFAIQLYNPRFFAPFFFSYVAMYFLKQIAGNSLIMCMNLVRAGFVPNSDQDKSFTIGLK